jgi:hypothetical protein
MSLIKETKCRQCFGNVVNILFQEKMGFAGEFRLKDIATRGVGNP